MDPARRYAIGQILRVLYDKKPLKNAEGQFWKSLEMRDQAFAERLIKATLRSYGKMSKLIRRCLTSSKLDDERLEPVLATAACELIVLDTPSYAVGSRYVDMVGDWNDGRYKGLVNAVIRRLAENGKVWNAQLRSEVALPRWLVKRWQHNWGMEACNSWSQLFEEQAAIDLVIGPGASVDETYAIGQLATPLPTGQLRLNADAGRVRDLPGFDNGAFWVQDVASYLPVLLFGDIGGKRVFDLCAAPGGKTMQMAASGAHVRAVDVDAQRLKRLRENLERVELTAEVLEADILRWMPEYKPDAILLDAPCSATGTLRHHPDVPWLRDEGSVQEYVELQAKMLNKALDMLEENGTLVYAVCSLEPEEGERQIDALLDRRTDVRLWPIESDQFPLPACVREQGWLRVFPSDVLPRGADGFFAARLVKVSPGTGGKLDDWLAWQPHGAMDHTNTNGEAANVVSNPKRSKLILKSEG